METNDAPWKNLDPVYGFFLDDNADWCMGEAEMSNEDEVSCVERSLEGVPGTVYTSNFTTLERAMNAVYLAGIQAGQRPLTDPGLVTIGHIDDGEANNSKICGTTLK